MAQFISALVRRYLSNKKEEVSHQVIYEYLSHAVKNSAQYKALEQTENAKQKRKSIAAALNAFVSKYQSEFSKIAGNIFNFRLLCRVKGLFMWLLKIKVSNIFNDAEKLYKVVTMPQNPPSGVANQEKAFQILEFLIAMKN